MRIARGLALVLVVGLLAAGCSKPRYEYKGPKVDAFTGQLVQNGKPVQFPAGSEPQLQLIFEEEARRFGIPIQPDGTFKIGWMPIGKYSAEMKWRKPGQSGKGATGPDLYTVPGGLTIEKGKTEYTIELGKAFKL